MVPSTPEKPKPRRFSRKFSALLRKRRKHAGPSFYAAWNSFANYVSSFRTEIIQPFQVKGMGRMAGVAEHRPTYGTSEFDYL